jgi:hypothetical protein
MAAENKRISLSEILNYRRIIVLQEKRVIYYLWGGAALQFALL